MSNKDIRNLPCHLSPLLQPTPSGVAKLIAAWDGLHPETHILLLNELKNARFPAYLAKKIRFKALDSPIAYVRYLAAREFIFNRDATEEEIALKERIEADPDPLVRYSLIESEWGFLDEDMKNPDAFFKLPQEERLAKVRQLTGSGETMAALIEYAVNHQLQEGKVSEIELFEILLDYVNKPSFLENYAADRWEHSYDGFGEFVAGKDIEALWALVPKLPRQISHVLIEHLPPAAGLSSGIPDNVLKEMTSGQLETLLYRQDVGLEKFRKELFLRPAERLDGLRSASIAFHFDFEYTEFAEILARPEQEKIDILRDLAVMANDLSLVLYDAIHDVLFATEATAFGGPWEDAARARNSLARRLGRLRGWQRDRQLRELRLYRLAKQSMPWKKGETGYPPSAELEFLSKLIVEGDTWATFMAFSKAWADSSLRTEKLEKHLPRIDEAGEDYWQDNHEAEGFVEVKKGLDEKISAIISRLKSGSEAEGPKLIEVFSELASYTTKTIESVLEAVKSLKSEITTLRLAQSRQRVLLFIMIGLLAWLVVTRW